ncbi:MAG: hypothetical protein PHT43_05370 [Anaerolineaceae bacterium]|nr:hypothetical protein [Anaerolineaceae bacterium]
MDFDMGDSSDFKVEIADIAVAKTWQAGNLKLGVNKDNGTSFIMVGGLPLLSVEAFEGEAAQALTGMLARPAWTIEGEGDLNARVKAVGKIYNNWKEVICCATNDTVSYAFETPGKNDDGILLKFPYWLVGCPCEVVLPDGGVKVASGRIPLRIGAAMSFGEFKEGYGLLIWLTNTEQLFLTFESPFLIKSYRGLPDGVEKRHFPKSLHSFQPGGLELRPRAKTHPRFTVKYRQFCRQVKHAAKTQTNDSAKESRDVCISQTDGVITVSNSWWEVLHDQRTGGLMSSVKFKGASGENILAAPEKLYLMVKETEFSSFNDRAASFIIDGGSLIVKGKLTAGDGTDCGVVYMTRYDYSDVCVKRRTVFSFAKAMKINRLGVLRLDFIPALDECGYKPVVAAFRKAVFPGPSIVNDMGLGHGFLTVFKSGGEGMDFVPGAETRQWTTQINVDPADRVYRISENDAGGASIIIEPCSNTNRQTQIKNCICFDYYLGLPKLGRKLCKQYFPIRYESWWFIKRDWVDGKVIRDAAEAGVTLAVDGNFGANWVGEPVPTNFSENEKKSFDTNKKRVEAWHQNNVKVVPFVGKGLIQNSMLPEPQKLMLWGKMGKDLKIEPTPWGAPMMCHCSEEFDRYYKKILCGWVDAFLFDGFYFDFCEPQGTCYNFNHARFPHSDVDGFLRFMQWSHSEFEVVYGHTGYYPTVMCENLVNLTWVGEEVNFWYSNDGRLPSISQMRDYFCHIPNTQRVVDPHIMASWRKLPLEPLKGNLRYSGTDSQEFTCRMALCGLFSEANMTAACPLSVKDVNTRFAPWLKAFSAFKGVDFTTLEFKDWKNQNAVVTGNACVKAAVYWNSEVVYLVLGNPESITRQACKFKLNVKSLGWCDENRPFELSRLPESKGKTRSITYAAMTDEGVPENLDAFEYCVYRLRPISQKR